MKKPELLAPAGSYESFLGAVHAGADAVYIGGGRFSARAYAENFTQDEVCRAVRYAHLLGRKVYLTVNTLLRQEEIEELYEYLRPFYECGLDAVIVQDLGVFRMVKKWFPGLGLHVSTQMTVTGAYGADLLKEWGADRIVPARELSLEEVAGIRRRAGVEVETFIHGAMCYCYSGQCLFSSVLGGRSGNRGRCAQPCRLPYGGENTYPLSLKDLCTIDLLPSLIEAGIDSFKIEGRMKKPEYAAGVTALYRKYIDRYFEEPGRPWRVEEKDRDCLRQLYVRSELSDGYYRRHNGREMITPGRPGYAGSSEALLETVRKEHLTKPLRAAVRGRLKLVKGQPVEFTVEIMTDREREDLGTRVCTVAGDVVMRAEKQPLTEEIVIRQMHKTGNTPFSLKELTVETEPDVFLPVRALNELRREAFGRLEELSAGTADAEKRAAAVRKREAAPERRRTDAAECGSADTAECRITDAAEYGRAGRPEHRVTDETPARVTAGKVRRTGLHASVTGLHQAEALLETEGITRLYLPADCLLSEEDAESEYTAHRIAPRKLEWWKEAVRRKKAECQDFESYLILPAVVRQRDDSWLEAVKPLLEMEETDGALTGSLEAYAWLAGRLPGRPVMADANLYVWNEEAVRLLTEQTGSDRKSAGVTLPLEGDRQMLRRLAAEGREMIVYGRTPMMVSANCIRKTCGECLLKNGRKEDEAGFYPLTDRYRKKFPVKTNCRHCYNIIYNSLPGSLHREIKQIRSWGLDALRLQFTIETVEETRAVAVWYTEALRGREPELPSVLKETTRGHFKNGVT